MHVRPAGTVALSAHAARTGLRGGRANGEVLARVGAGDGGGVRYNDLAGPAGRHARAADGDAKRGPKHGVVRLCDRRAAGSVGESNTQARVRAAAGTSALTAMVA